MTLRGAAVVALRTVSVLAGAAAFSLLATDEWLLRAVAFSIFVVFFALGVNWRLIHAVAVKRLEPRPDVAWSGGGAATCIGVLLVACVCAALGLKATALALLGAHGVAINVTYIGAKTSCLAAGCCKRVPDDAAHADLRLVEMMVSIGFALAGVVAMLYSLAWVAAVICNGGHLALRLYSYHARGELAHQPLRVLARKLDLLPLIASALIAPSLT